MDAKTSIRLPTADDLRRLIVCDTDFGDHGETDLGLEAMQRLEQLGWLTEGDENFEYTLTEAGRLVVRRALGDVVAFVQFKADRAGRTYIAGPMTGYADFNYPAFNAAAAQLRSLGIAAINPADHGVVPGATWEDYLRSDIAQLASCESIYFLPGWSKSRGALLEHHIATSLGMRLLFAADAEKPSPNGRGDARLLALAARWRGMNGADLPPYHPDIGGSPSNGRYYLDLVSDELEAAVAATCKEPLQVGEALFGQPEMGLIEIANRCNAEASRAGGALLSATGKQQVGENDAGQPHKCRSSTGAQVMQVGGVQGDGWIAFADRWPNESTSLDDSNVKTTDKVLVTNNLKSLDAMGRMSHVWWARPIRADRKGGEVVAFTEADRKLHGLTHWLDPFAARQPDTTLASIYELLGVRNESDAGAEIARLHIAARQPVGQEQLVPHVVALELIGDAYNAGGHGIGYSQQAMELRDAIVAPPAQAVDVEPQARGIRLIEIPRRNNLDPINVFVQDYELGRGRVVVTCYGQAWCGFWGAMGDRTVMQFVASCNADYVAGNMLSGRHEFTSDDERTYVLRIATEVITEFRALIESQAGVKP